MKIQQHDSMVVDAAVTAAGLRRSSVRGRGVAGEREVPRVKGAAAPPSPLDGSRWRRRHADCMCVERGGAVRSALGSPVI